MSKRKDLRAIYSHNPEPERIFGPESCWLVIGPFESHMDQFDVQEALEAVLKIANGYEVIEAQTVLQKFCG